MTEDSRQPRLHDTEAPGQALASFLRILTFALEADELPVWGNSARDAELRELWKKEPLLAGVLGSAKDIAANRAWDVVPVDYEDTQAVAAAAAAKAMLNAAQVYPSIRGFSGSGRLVAVAADDYYATDTGTVIELSRSSKMGPVTGLYYMDAANVTLCGNAKFPLTYWPPEGQPEYIRIPDKPLPMYIRVPDIVDPDETQYGLGYCAVSRAALLAQTIVALWQHDYQKLSNLPPVGVVLLGGISQEQWDESFKLYRQSLKNKKLTHYTKLMVLAREEGKVESELLAFSQLPEHFQRDIMVETYMFGLSLIFGFDAGEFWPRAYGGTKGEATIQHRKSLQKGVMTFLLALQQEINNILPENVIFKFDERDDAQDELRARIRRIRAERRRIDLESGVINREEARELALLEGDLTPEQFARGVPEWDLPPRGAGGGERDQRTAGGVQVDEHLPGSFYRREEV